MGKETQKGIMHWINEELHLKLSKKALIGAIDESDIPDEIKTWFSDIKNAVKDISTKSIFTVEDI